MYIAYGGLRYQSFTEIMVSIGPIICYD